MFYFICLVDGLYILDLGVIPSIWEKNLQKMYLSQKSLLLNSSIRRIFWLRNQTI